MGSTLRVGDMRPSGDHVPDGKLPACRSARSNFSANGLERMTGTAGSPYSNRHVFTLFAPGHGKTGKDQQQHQNENYHLARIHISLRYNQWLHIIIFTRRCLSESAHSIRHPPVVQLPRMAGAKPHPNLSGLFLSAQTWYSSSPVEVHPPQSGPVHPTQGGVSSPVWRLVFKTNVGQ